jgi:cation:H+ antiporter
MQEYLVYILFVLGFLLLIKGADWLVSGSSSIARRFNISDFIVGLTIVSLGTSMPELIVNILASVEGSSGIAMGNIIGSNISNIFLILGVSALIFPLKIEQGTVKMEVPYSILATLLLAYLANATLLSDKAETPMLDHLDGLILLVFFMMFIVYIIRIAKEGRSNILDAIPMDEMSLVKAVGLILLGCVGLFFGGKWVVDGAQEIALQAGLSESLVGLTIVAIGTSLPELVTSAMAAYKKNTDIAVANVLGSNIFNILWVLGLSAIIRPLKFDLIINTDILILVAGSLVIMGSIVIGKRNSIDRGNGIFFLMCYIFYIYYLIIRG